LYTVLITLHVSMLNTAICRRPSKDPYEAPS
jgi:hypothetical protein